MTIVFFKKKALLNIKKMEFWLQLLSCNSVPLVVAALHLIESLAKNVQNVRAKAIPQLQGVEVICRLLLETDQEELAVAAGDCLEEVSVFFCFVVVRFFHCGHQGGSRCWFESAGGVGTASNGFGARGGATQRGGVAALQFRSAGAQTRSSWAAHGRARRRVSLLIWGDNVERIGLII